LNLRQRLSRICGGDVDMATQKVGHNLASALEGDKIKLHASCLLHEMRNNRVHARRARATDLYVLRCLARAVDKIAYAPVRRGCRNNHDEFVQGKPGDERVVAIAELHLAE